MLLKKLPFVYLFLILIQQNLWSQQVELTGKVASAEESQWLEFSSVALLAPRDSALVAGTYTDTEGVFALKANPGNYLLRINFLGYETKWLQGVVLDPQESVKDLGLIQLAQKSTTLDEVEIQAQKSRMEFHLDKRVFNVGQDLANVGGTASDLLDNIPSITVDIEGNVSLRGNSNVRILVNGRPSGLSSTEALQQFSANMIEKVEIITNPSSRYEAEGTAGIINIVLKKNRRYGWNGSFDGTVGIPTSHNLSANLNFRTKKLNWFANLGGRLRNTPRNSSEYREDYDDLGNIELVMDQQRTSTRGGKSGSGRFGLDYSFDENTTLTGSIVYRKSDDFNTSVIDQIFQRGDFERVGSSLRDNEEEEDEENLDYNIRFERKFSGKDHKLTASLVYTSEWEREYTEAFEQDFDGNNQFLNLDESIIDNEEDTRETRIQVDYERPIGEKGKFEVGYLSNIRNIDTRFQVDEFNQETRVWEILQNQSNRFDYDEDIHAFYSSFGNDLGSRFSYQLGLRAEYTMVETLLKDTEEGNRSEYMSLFPSVFLNYELKEGNALQWSYSRRLRRPRFWDLNPFFNYSNPISQRSGNPKLNPEFSNAFELSYIRSWEKASVSASVYYRHTTDAITRIRSIDTTQVVLTSDGSEQFPSVSRPENIATEQNMGAEFSVNISPSRRVDVTWSGNIFFSTLDANNLSFSTQTEFVSWTSRLNSRVGLPWDVDMQVMVNYRGPAQNPQGTRKAMLFTDLGLSKDLLGDKMTVSFRMSDIFNTQWYRSETTGENFFIYSEGQWRARRQSYINITYRLNQKKQRQRGYGGGNRDMGGPQ